MLSSDSAASGALRPTFCWSAAIVTVAVCGSRNGLVDLDGLEPDQMDALAPSLSGPDFIEPSGADLLVEAGPSDFSHRWSRPYLYSRLPCRWTKYDHHIQGRRWYTADANYLQPRIHLDNMLKFSSAATAALKDFVHILTTRFLAGPGSKT